MARKFSGKYSPDSGTPAPARLTSQTSIPGRARLLFFAPLPLLFTGFDGLRSGDISSLAGHYGGGALLLLAAWLLRDGLIAEAAFEARTTARRPAFPRKIFASGLTGFGMFVVATLALGQDLGFSLVLALVCAALHSFSFGLDPLKNKAMQGIDAFANERVATAVENAEEQLALMQSAIRRLGDRQLIDCVDKFSTTAQAMFRTVENDPRDLPAARKYLGVYLRGAAEATTKLAALGASGEISAARADYAALLDDLEHNFAARQRDLLLDDRGDLDVEIEVLRERLQADGLLRDT